MAKVSKYARKHARARTGTPFDLHEVLHEYEVLRQTLLNFLETDQALPTRERDIILNAIHTSTRAAATEYIRLFQEKDVAPLPRAIQRRRGLIRYPLSIAIVAMTALLQRLLWPIIEPFGYFLFYPAIAIASLWGDGATAIFLSVLCAHYFFIPPDHSLLPQDGPDAIRALIFVANGFIVWGITHTLRRSSVRAQTALTEQLAARRDSEEREAELSAIFESVSSGLMIGDETGFYRTNRRALELMGFDRTEDLKRDLSVLAKELHLRDPKTGEPLAASDLAFMHALRDQTPFSREILIRNRKTGEDRILRSDAAPVFVEDEMVAAVSVQTDITFLKRSEQMERAAKEELQREREMRVQFVNTLTHDLRNPLTSAKAASQLVLRRSDLPEAAAPLLARIVRSLERAERMIEDLLDANRIRARQGIPISVEEFELGDAIGEAVEEMTTIFGERFQHSSPRIVGRWSRKYLVRIIENLLSNAVKYGDSVQPVSISAKEDDQTVEISIHNYGNPIPQEQLEQIFQPFLRAPNVKNIRGWGLGLTLVLGVVQAHGGSIDVESDATTGTTFRIKLPRVTAAAS